jgi:16S rRNA (cytosine967-C5)-methyltransferase
MPISPARTVAFEILLRVMMRDAYASELLHSERCAKMSPADRGLATELVMGVLRWQSAIDAAIAIWSSQKLPKVDSEVLIALRLGAYQLGWLDRIPPHAVIHESVELVKSARKRSAAPFVNAVLRKLAESKQTIRPEQVASTWDSARLAKAWSHPRWIVQRWIMAFGIKVATQICRYNQTVPVTTIRLRDKNSETLLQSEDIVLAPASWLPNSRRVISGDVTRTRAYQENQITIQDEASQLVAAVVGSGSRILDCCAAPGGKTWAIADRNPDGRVIAVELHAHRAHALAKRVTAPNVQVIHADIRRLPIGAEFDRVLVDAPCSGTGTLARNPEIKWRLENKDLGDLQARQVDILESGMRCVGLTGRLIYATCSLEHEEGDGVIEKVLRRNEGFRLINGASILKELAEDGDFVAADYSSIIDRQFLRTLPGTHNCDGFFIAVLERHQ